MSRVRAALLALVAAALVAPASVLAAPGSNSSAPSDAPACAPAAPEHVTCFARVKLQRPGGPRVQAAAAVGAGGYAPSDLESAYAVAVNGGRGQKVAVVDVADDPNAAGDLATYRAAYGLPSCGAGCFTKINMGGAATPDAGWATEISLDLDMV